MKVFLEDNPWIPIELPHDWNTSQPSDPEAYPSNGFKPRGVAWYYNEFDMPEFGDDACVLLEFEGVMGECVVYVNGVLSQRNESGYTGFFTDVSDYLLPGQKNMIVVSVDNRRWEGWWYEGAGIYRPARLYIKPVIHFSHMKTFVRPQLQCGDWQVHIKSEIDNCRELDSSFCVESRILNANGDCVASIAEESRIPALGTATVNASVLVADPDLWSTQTPNLYTLENRLIVNGGCVETELIPFGFRDIQWTDHGMFINGKLTPVRGICCHQDHAGVGAAVTQSLTRYRVARLKEMGCNAYRCAHHCPSRYLLQVCDEMGMLVMAENRHYRVSDEVMKQLDALTLLCRNHPSVFLYSLFNEEPWQAESRGRRMAERMLGRIRINDDSRAITAAMNGGVLTKENASDVLDVAGMNYYIDDYMTYAARRPGHPMLGTENGPLYATRGIYHSDPQTQVYDSYGLNTAPFGQKLQQTMEAVEAAPHVAGLFVWGGFDYRGEPQPFEWPSVFSHWGLTDNCGFKKDTFYMLKSYYSDADKPMLHLLPHWNWNPGETVRVCAMTNCDTVRLYLNDRPFEGEKKVVRNRVEWQVPYEPGTIRAQGAKGEQMIEDEVRTAGIPSVIEVSDAAPEKDFDSAIINVCLLDDKGVPVPGRNTDREIRFQVMRGELIGSGNGDPNGIQPDITDHISTFCGRCQAIIRPDAEGRVNVNVLCEGLPRVSYMRGD
ncbi:MAG: glycoside hydrolase family 2 TIM barrel-domain containing protein [Clostridia bacterium]|nr:glycoside hydrolase family 2 TIM barrel-domain containing protein [Clostridia bacterium]